jgi:flagellar hook-basal body complex protein FliE
MSINNISGVLNQIRHLQTQQGIAGGNAGAVAAPGSAEGGFGKVLAESISKVSNSQQQAAELSGAFARGESGVELSDVMLALNKSSVSFKAMAEVRNRLVSSYQDIMNMPI